MPSQKGTSPLAIILASVGAVLLAAGIGVLLRHPNPLLGKSAVTIAALLLVWGLLLWRKLWMGEALWADMWDDKPIRREKRDEIAGYASVSRIKAISAVLFCLLILMGVILMWIFA